MFLDLAPPAKSPPSLGCLPPILEGRMFVMGGEGGRRFGNHFQVPREEVVQDGWWYHFMGEYLDFGFPASRSGTTTLYDVPGPLGYLGWQNRFLASLNVFKYVLRKIPLFAHSY
jgi:hypothetical protein